MTCVYSLNRVHIKTSKQNIYELISEKTRKGISVESVIRTEVYSTSCKLERKTNLTESFFSTISVSCHLSIQKESREWKRI